MHPTELTISDALRDPIIRQVLRADGISIPAFAVFLQEAARRQQKNATASPCSKAVNCSTAPYVLESGLGGPAKAAGFA